MCRKTDSAREIPFESIIAGFILSKEIYGLVPAAWRLLRIWRVSFRVNVCIIAFSAGGRGVGYYRTCGTKNRLCRCGGLP